jgi:hypothetical protein
MALDPIYHFVLFQTIPKRLIPSTLKLSKLKSDTYVKFKKEYLHYSGKTHGVVCTGGAVLVRLPVLFRGAQGVTPKVRRILGKA